MSHHRPVIAFRHGWIAGLAIGVAILLVPASLAQARLAWGMGQSAETPAGSEARRTQDELSGGLSIEAPAGSGVSIEVPVGKVWVSPEVVAGEPVYVRRATVQQGMAVVEVSTTPFVVEAAGGDPLVYRPDLPASW